MAGGATFTVSYAAKTNTYWGDRFTRRTQAKSDALRRRVGVEIWYDLVLPFVGSPMAVLSLYDSIFAYL